MAVATQFMKIKVSQIYHHKEYNVARLSGDSVTDAKRKELLGSMIRDGWWDTQDGTLDAIKITKEWADRAVLELTKEWEGLKAKAEKNGNELPRLHCFEVNHVKKGKIIVPEYMGGSGNCRFGLLLEANVARYTTKPTLEHPEPLSLITEIPVCVRSYENERERAIAQMLDNLGKNIGFSRPSEKDMLKCAKFILEQGGIQSDIRRAFGESTGQKIYGIITLDTRFPGVKLLKRITDTDPVDPTFIRYGGIKGSDLPKLVLRSDPKALEEQNRKERTAGRGDLLPLTESGLEDALGTPRTNEPKIMKKENITALQTQNPNNVIKAVAKAIMLNNSDIYNKFTVHAPLYNAVESLCDLGVGPDLEAILNSLTSAPDLGVAVKTLKASMKV